jgi:phosphatidylinositol alpha-1,6-mannosyltransferase
MRLLFVSHSLPPEGRPLENVGGMQRVAIDLHDTLAAHSGADVRMLVLRSGWNERGYSTPLFLARALREIRRLARAKEIDAVLFSSMLTATLSVPLRPLLKRMNILSAAIVNGLDATTPTWPYPLIVRRAFRALDLVMPISRATEDACIARGLDPKKSKVISLGIRSDRFQQDRDRAEARHELEAKGHDGKLLLCSVGRLVPRKGVAWFIANVVPLLPENILYLVAGEGPDRPRIEKLISDYRLERSVKLLGAITDEELETLYNGADLFLMPNVPVPNDMEGFGLVMLEAGMCGLPTVASNIEGIADVITEGRNGHLVTAEDPDSFREAIMRYYENPSLIEPLSESAREYTTSRFGWSGVIDEYLRAISGRMG